MSSSDAFPTRIGDAERDLAVEQLQEHYSLGRLDAGEFEERMGRAMQARTAPELAVLFRDLPGTNPGVAQPPPQPTYFPPPAPHLYAPAPARPWYANWWLILLVAVMFLVMARGVFGMMFPMMIIGPWVAFALLAGHRTRHLAAARTEVQVSLTEWERQLVVDELVRGRRIQAIRLYRQFTGAGLRDAKDAVEQIQRQIGR